MTADAALPGAPPAPRPKGLVWVQVAYAVFLPVWFVLAIAASFAGESGNLAIETSIVVVWLYPLVLLPAVIMTWVSHHRGHAARARTWNAVPAAYLVLFVLAFALLLVL